MSASPDAARGEPHPAPRADARERRPRWRLLDLAVALLAFAGAWLSLDLWRISLGAVASNPLLASVCDPRAVGLY